VIRRALEAGHDRITAYFRLTDPNLSSGAVLRPGTPGEAIAACCCTACAAGTGCPERTALLTGNGSKRARFSSAPICGRLSALQSIAIDSH